MSPRWKKLEGKQSTAKPKAPTVSLSRERALWLDDVETGLRSIRKKLAALEAHDRAFRHRDRSRAYLEGYRSELVSRENSVVSECRSVLAKLERVPSGPFRAEDMERLRREFGSLEEATRSYSRNLLNPRDSSPPDAETLGKLQDALRGNDAGACDVSQASRPGWCDSCCGDTAGDDLVDTIMRSKNCSVCDVVKWLRLVFATQLKLMDAASSD